MSPTANVGESMLFARSPTQQDIECVGVLLADLLEPARDAQGTSSSHLEGFSDTLQEFAALTLKLVPHVQVAQKTLLKHYRLLPQSDFGSLTQ